MSARAAKPVAQDNAEPGVRARTNRQRILGVATVEMARNPSVSMEDIARAAGVVRRTLYGHFPSREILIEGILDQAAEHIDIAVRSIPDHASAGSSVAWLVMALWEIGDRYRLLFKLIDTDLRPRVQQLLAPVHAHGAELIRKGQRDGTFARHLPPELSTKVVDAVLQTLLAELGGEVWCDPHAGATAAWTALMALGVSRGRAKSIAGKVSVSCEP